MRYCGDHDVVLANQWFVNITVVCYVTNVAVDVVDNLCTSQTYVNGQRVQGDQGVWLQSCDQVKCGHGKNDNII